MRAAAAYMEKEKNHISSDDENADLKSAFEAVREMISRGEVSAALERLKCIETLNPNNMDEVFYLRGNAYRKLGDWRMALNNYSFAEELNPNGAAAEAKRVIMNILEFYNKDMYNQ